MKSSSVHYCIRKPLQGATECMSFSLEINHSEFKLATESAHVIACNNIKVLNVYNLTFICQI